MVYFGTHVIPFSWFVEQVRAWAGRVRAPHMRARTRPSRTWLWTGQTSPQRNRGTWPIDCACQPAPALPAHIQCSILAVLAGVSSSSLNGSMTPLTPAFFCRRTGMLLARSYRLIFRHSWMTLLRDTYQQSASTWCDRDFWYL
jgi:hypothetical protein